MIKIDELPTAKPGTPGLTFFWYADVKADDFHRDGWLMKSHDLDALRSMRAAMARESRNIQSRSWRRQYAVPTVKHEPGLRTIDTTEIFVRPTHFRVIWFAEAVQI